MFNKILSLTATIAVASIATSAIANDTPIRGNVASKCSIYTDTPGVYGNPAPDVLSTDPSAGGVVPIVRYDVAIANYYTARIQYPTSFSTSPGLTDAVNWSGTVEVSATSTTDMAAYESTKIEYDNVVEYDLTAAGSTWFKVNSLVTYGFGKSLPGGEYTALVVAECIAN